MELLKLVVVGFISFLSAFAIASEKADSYFCVTEESTGFLSFDGDWGIHSLPLEDKFVLRQITADDEQYKIYGGAYSHGLFSHGSKSSSMKCNFEGFYSCEGMGQFFFDPNTGRFLKTRTWGYWFGDDEKVSYPNI
ncbi:hypothetical protein GCM10009347_41800 [Shewanella algicola]|uniref:S-protein homolog n=1 Tax=Shewanella algicola TaxID=640633 RepID=A0A9X1ZBM4_9GAMM|nr:hypothetical protein [Shewanella algicola]MCL1107774.1 hypothetical protein [Shewanella algicola]GGP72807.1 hypothetical protein GCM10009347_41800 [Shewanella algicola]